MFDVLARYLFEVKKLSLPRIGVFELKSKEASANLASATIAPPSWIVQFTSGQEAETADNAGLINWLALNGTTSAEEARVNFDHFVSELQTRLDNGEQVEWPDLGTLQKNGVQVLFNPAAEEISPFTPVAAKKIIRENTSHQTLVGDKETTTAQMREQLLLPDEKRRSGGAIMWILLGIALIAAAWFFSQNGCNPSSTGNRQKVEAAKPGDTYKIK